MTSDRLATRRGACLLPDPSRVVAQLFVPGHTLAEGGERRVSGGVQHILALSEAEVTQALGDVVERFGGRHRDLTETFSHHADRVENRLDPDVKLSRDRWLLLGATFTQEYAVEAAALCNPSAVPLPDQSSAPAGALRFVMSVRQIGEGHRSSIGFRTGTVDDGGEVTIDEAGPFTTAGTVETTTLDADVFQSMASEADHDAESTRWVLDRLDDNFTVDELDDRLSELESQHDTRRDVASTARRIRNLASRTYTTRFSATSELGERVLLPAAAMESHGLEDARFVRFVEDDGTTTYYAPYTAYNGSAIAQQLLETEDFSSFVASPVFGAAATNKGMALFPRRINGKFAALSRHDGATNGVAFSNSIRHWPGSVPLQPPTEEWETVQVGNCGSPIETDEGWVVLTHGVGPMRVYSIGALLLDLDDPTRVVGRTRQPLLSPRPDEQDGYVPNVVYSCGGLLHGATLTIPFGICDQRVGFATVSMPDLLAAMREDAAVPQVDVARRGWSRSVDVSSPTMT